MTSRWHRVNPPHGPLRAVLLDIDGTLVDSNDAHAEAWQSAFEQFGFDVPLTKVRAAIGKGGDKLLAELIGVPRASDEGEAIEAERKRIFRTQLLNELRPMPRARELVQRLLSLRLRVIAATSASRDEVDALLQIAEVDELVEHGATADDVARSKPDPDVLHAALDSLGLHARDAILIGDTPYDVEAAVRVNMDVIAVRSGGWPDTFLHRAIEIYDDVADLCERFADSPIALRCAHAYSYGRQRVRAHAR